VNNRSPDFRGVSSMTKTLTKLTKMTPTTTLLAVSVTLAGALAACTWSPALAPTNTGGAGHGATGGTGGVPIVGGTGGVPVGNGTGNGGSTSITGGGPGKVVPIPADYTKVDVGGFKLGAPIDPASGNTSVDSPAEGCFKVVGVVRDFKGSNEAGGHPDFETYSGSKQTTALVGPMLGGDRKPIYGAACDMAGTTAACPYGQQMTTKAAFDQWYRTVADTNKAYQISFIFEPNGNVTTFQSDAFFPLDGAGFNNGPNNHNFGFTTELHTKFVYKGGEVFTFKGDDDLWVFVNRKLALDLGGLHPEVTGSIDMDTMAASLGLVKGTAYDIELFHAERHTSASHFRVDTNFVFVDCGIIIP
jgi:fibro-slime domain-containing protein